MTGSPVQDKRKWGKLVSLSGPPGEEQGRSTRVGQLGRESEQEK